MKYYYSIKGETRGPVEIEELDRLAKDGIIRGKTPVIEVGGREWSRYSVLRPETAGSVPPPPVAGESFVSKLLSLNAGVDKLLARVFRLPSFVPTDEAGRLAALNKLASITGLLIWASVIVALLGAGLALKPLYGLYGALAGVIYGFVLQYIGYLLFCITNSLLVGHPIVLSSAAFPRLVGVLALVGGVVGLVVMLIGADMIGEWVMAICLTLPTVVLVYLCMNAEALMVKVSPSEVSPGRDFNNSIKFLLRAIIASWHLVIPVLAVLAAVAVLLISLEVDMSKWGAIESLMEAATPMVAILHLPIITWLALCLTSWLFDLYDAFFSLGAGTKK